MGSHHHHHHHHSQCCCCNCNCSSTPSPPPLTSSDQLLKALATHLLQSPPSHHLFTQQHLKPQYHPQQFNRNQNPQQHHYDQQTQSLLRRVAALESSLPRLSSPSSPSPPPPPQQPRRPSPPRLSLRDLAARTIQSRFRLFLVRRSKTLRDLKHLASVKSQAASLKSSLSGKTHLSPNPKALSQAAMDLLHQLDSIQSLDPMIREGKRSISRELVRILEFVDKVLVKQAEFSLNATEITEDGGDRGASAENLGRRIERIGGFSRDFEDDEEVNVRDMRRHVLSSKPVKRVSFAENGQSSRVYVGAHEPNPEETDDHTVLLERLSREANGSEGFPRFFEDEEEHLGGEGFHFHQVSDDGESTEKNPRGTPETGVMYGIGGHFQGQNGNLGLSPPLPVQMESRSDFKKKFVNGS